MSNMSYCMFENALGDLADCKYRLEEKGVDEIREDSSEEEVRAMESLILMCREIAEEYGDE